MLIGAPWQFTFEERMRRAMRELRDIDTVVQEYGAFRPNWKNCGQDVLSHPEIGSIRHCVVCEEDGTPVYDQPLWVEPVGAICVPVLADGRIAILEHEREAVSVAGGKQKSGLVSFELPRGFPLPGEVAERAAIREVEEETGLKARTATNIGLSNTNTSFFANSNGVFLVNVETGTVNRASDHRERIRHVHLMSLDAIFKMAACGEIVCGMTKSALLTYLVWSRMQGEDSIDGM